MFFWVHRERDRDRGRERGKGRERGVANIQIIWLMLKHILKKEKFLKEHKVSSLRPKHYKK